MATRMLIKASLVISVESLFSFTPTNMTIAQQLIAEGISLSAPATPAAAYVMTQRIGNTFYVSGHLSKKDGAVWVGKLGTTITTAQGKDAARAAAIDLIGTLQAAVGDLEKVRIVKLMGLVNSSAEFTEHHLVINGASELLVKIFGDKGIHARSAFGVAQIPLGACVEIELIAEVLP